jgi:hypothetical protein
MSPKDRGAGELADEKERVNHRTAIASGHFIECHAGLGSESNSESEKDINKQCPQRRKYKDACSLPLSTDRDKKC